MHAFGPRTLGKIFDDAACHTAGDAERVDDAPAIELQSSRYTSCRRNGAEHRGWMEARLVNELGCHQAEPAHGLHSDCNTGQRRRAVRTMALARRHHRRHDDGARVYRAALESI